MSQIRIANKQDEPHIRALAKDALASISQEIDLDGVDADLKNVEWSYFGHDGVFFVLEVDGKIAGYAGAAKLSEDAIEIKRLFVQPDSVQKLEGLLDMLIDFARKMDYRLVECSVGAAVNAPAALLSAKKFEKKDGRLIANVWSA